MLEEDEEILLEKRPSRKGFIGYYLISIFFIGLGSSFLLDLFSLPSLIKSSFVAQIIPFSLDFSTGIFCFSLSLLFFLYPELKRFMLKYIVTDSRVLERKGILRKTTSYIPYIKLEKSVLDKSLIDRIFKIGTIEVDAGEDSLFLRKVSNPEEVDDLIFKVGLKNRKRREFEREMD